MAQDQPSAGILLAAISEFLERDILAATDGRLRFDARIAANLLRIIGRELELGAAHDRAEAADLKRLLDKGGSPSDLNRELTARLREGALDASDEQVMAHLRASVRRKLLIANPTYLDRDVRSSGDEEAS